MASLYGFTIDTEIRLGRLRAGDGGRGVVKVRCAGPDLLSREGELVSWTDEGGAEFALARSEDALLAWCSTTGAYALHAARGEIRANPAGHSEVWEHRFGSTILPLLLSERDDLVLHAAAIGSGEQAVVVCGRSGAGKSTLSTALGLDGRAILSEDGVVVSWPGEHPMTWPGPAGCRINARSAAALGLAPPAGELAPGATKMLHQGLGAPAVPLPVGALMVLGPREGSEARLRQLDPPDALVSIAAHAFVAQRERVAVAIEHIARLVERVPVFAVTLPDALGRLRPEADRLLGAVLDASAAGRGSAASPGV